MFAENSVCYQIGAVSKAFDTTGVWINESAADKSEVNIKTRVVHCLTVKLPTSH